MAVIVIAHSKGGVGKSLIAWHLAIAKNIPILDLDYQKSLVFANKFRINNNYKAIEIEQPLSQKEFIDFLENYPEDKDIVVDVGGFDSSTNRVALFIADIIITSVNEDIQEIAGLIKFHATLEELSEKMKKEVKAHIVINNVNPNTRDFSIVGDMVTKHTLYEKLNTIIARRVDFSRAMKEGLGIIEFTRDSHNKARASIYITKKRDRQTHKKYGECIMAKKKYDINALMEAGKNAHLTDNFVDISQSNSVDGEQYIKLNIETIGENPLQPRKSINKEELDELAKSIELHGLIHPISVMRVSDKKLILLAGQRRLLAYKSLGKEDIPAIVREDDRFKNLAKLDMLNDVTIAKILFEISVSENESREPLTPLELALSIDEVLQKKVYGSVNEVAKVLGKSKAYITKIYSTLKLAKHILKEIEETRGVRHIEALYELQKIKDEKLQVGLYFKLKAGEININNIKTYSVLKRKNAKTPYDFKISKNNIILKINTKLLSDDKKDILNTKLQSIIDEYVKS